MTSSGFCAKVQAAISNGAQARVTASIPKLEPISQRATNLKVYDQVRDAIAAGRFKPGDSLSTRQFADALGVSQMPVREAFHRLVAEGALENRSNRTIGLPLIKLSEFNEIAEIRIMLESLAARKAAANLGPKDCAKLHQLSQDMEVASDRQDNARYLVMNRRFHFSIYRGSGSVELVRLIEQLWLRIGPFLNWISTPQDSRTRSKMHHLAIIHACEKHDGEAAAAAVADDLRDGAEMVRAKLRAME
jgi:DNA-binding GntR family transcriptional regulator